MTDVPVVSVPHLVHMEYLVECVMEMHCWVRWEHWWHLGCLVGRLRGVQGLGMILIGV